MYRTQNSLSKDSIQFTKAGGKMREGFSLELSQQQRLALTQEMKLSINILAMSVLELREYIDKELEENPLLEESQRDTPDNESEKNIMDYEAFLKYMEFDRYDDGRFERSSDSDSELSPFQFISEQKSLKDFLKEQLMELDRDETLKICGYMIDSLDHRGYLSVSLEEISRELKVSDEAVEKSLCLLQSFEPDGIGARDLKECLSIQLRKKGIEDEILFQVIYDYLEPLSENKYSIIAKKLSISTRQVQEYGRIIKALNPIPSSGFYTGEELQFIIPEAFIRKIGEEYVIIMNDKVLPSLNVNESYKNIIKAENDKTASEYVKNKINSAIFLIKSIEQRKKTLYKILEKLLEFQLEYFEYGESRLKPMSLKDIAYSLNIHESTVSRAIKDKYISTQRGMVKIKDMFTARISAEKDDMSAKSVKVRIKELIGSEDKAKPLSDQDISSMLEQEGTFISRRTVAKYREEMGIGSSNRRKK
jgi:RNA polymerase sigma-54 factor